MSSLKGFKLRAGRAGKTIAALIISTVPAFTPLLASAETVTDRSIALSSSTKSATSVTYNVVFTPVGAAGATALQFCSNTPLIGESCTAPAGLDVSSAAVASATSVSVPTVAASQGPVVVIEQSITATATTLTVTGVTNPSSAGSLYVRIVTYDTKAHAEADYTATGAGGDNDGIGGTGTAATNAVDNGSIALSITNEIGVQAAVLESLTFCVSGSDITGAGCSAGVTAPTLTLGETVGTVKALTASAVSTGDIWTQISTNAASGAVVSLKSGNACGGLKRAEAAGCDIAPAQQTNITNGQAKIGVLAIPFTTHDGAGDLNASGTYQAVPTSGYNGTTYALNFNGTTDGVASVYGDPIFNTNGTQPSNKEMQLTFGASVSNNTPAGSYSNNYSLIATGTF